jgi:SDR family mycofactocin-dependent oxidoreductase
MGLLDGRVAVISGVARGQGRATAVRLAEEGADIIGLDVCSDLETIPYPLSGVADLEETAENVRALGQQFVSAEVDVRESVGVRDAIDAGVSKLGRLDIVVANAGVASYAPAAELTDEQWSTVIDTNLSGVWHVVRASIPHIRAGGRGGSIVLTSSTAAHMGYPNMAHYGASKGGIVGLMQSLAVELGPNSIRVNTLHPSTVNTPMALNDATYELFMPGMNLSDGSPLDNATLVESFKAMHVLPVPWVEPADVANAALFMASDLSRCVTGTQLRIDAGAVVR